ncbi:MAG: YdiU family protein [bacterium]|nr:YdiU family protein [bacterium]
MNKEKEVVETGFHLENTYAKLPEKLFSRQDPSSVRSPKLVVLNLPLIESLGLNPEELKGEIGVGIFSGNKIPKGSTPIAQAYAGHQFGYFTMLGDGRAVLLGEYVTPQGERLDIQLKGSGRTPYSRGGDGKATIGPMLREYIISEAMYALGIPTTRSLAVVTTGENIARETYLPGAVLTRVAKSHIRVGTFQYTANWGTIEDLKALADYTLERHFKGEEIKGNPYLYLLRGVIRRQAELVAKWQLVGFIHGVMNTDNVTISGETIDYGPCAFMDTYDPKTVFSSIDTGGRYAYGNQPQITAWNLARFAETLLPLLSTDQEEAVAIAQEEIAKFSDIYHEKWMSGMRGKLGLFTEEAEDEVLVERLLELMEKEQADYTNMFLDLTFNHLQDTKFYEIKEFKEWYKLWNERRNRQDQSEEESKELMKRNNPAVIPRNHRVEEALEAAVQYYDYSVMEKLLLVLSDPYAHSKEQEAYKDVSKALSCGYKTYCGT